METPTGRPAGIRPLIHIGGHLALDFANTVDDPDGPLRWDHIADYDALLTWSVEAGVMPDPVADGLRRSARATPATAAAAVANAAALRSVLCTIYGAVVDGLPLDSSWDNLREFVATAIANARLEHDTCHSVPTWDFTDLESPLWPVADAAYRLLTDPGLARLKRCAGCPWLFLDQSKNASRRWCSMQDCGTHAKIRRYVATRAARRKSVPRTIT